MQEYEFELPIVIHIHEIEINFLIQHFSITLIVF